MVVALLVVLLSMLMPSLRSAHRQAVRLQCSAQLKAMVLATNLYVDDSNGYLPPGSDSWRDNASGYAGHLIQWYDLGWQNFVCPSRLSPSDPEESNPNHEFALADLNVSKGRWTDEQWCNCSF